MQPIQDKVKNNESISPSCARLLQEMLLVEHRERPTMCDLWSDCWVADESLPPLNPRCSQYVEVTQDDINTSVTVVPKLETLIMVKQMLKRHSFRNPFLTGKKTE